jgi:lysophospholipase L1-like esterase
MFFNHLSNALRSFRYSSFALGTTVLLLSIIILSGFVNTKSADGWVGSWSTAQQLVEPGNMPPAPGLSNNTLRQVVRVSIGGKKLRLRFSNEFSKSPVTMKNVHIAVSEGSGGSGLIASTIKSLKFNGKNEVTMAPGVAVTSDEFSFDLKPRMDIAITIAFGETSPDVTGHPGSRTTSYILTGDQSSASADFTNASKTDHWYVINAIDVKAPKSGASIAVLGNSITDGRGSGTNKQNRWTDILSERLLKNKPTRNIGVLNMGLGGNCVLRDCLGPAGVNRIERDVLKQAGIRWLIVLEGVNDIGGTRDSVSAMKVANGLIEAYAQIIDKAHGANLKVYGATILPFGKAGYDSKPHEAARTKVNEWIRNSGRFDAVIDFDKALRDPKAIANLLPAADTGDHLHPNETGYKMMGDVIDLSLFK